jgi:hypothetical protein
LWVAGLWLLWLAIAVPALLSGVDYYTTPMPERAFSELHERYSPAGSTGHALGVIGSGMILVGVVMYATRKRVPALARLGRLKHWLEVHIFLCTLGPFLVLLHTSFKFGGIVSIAFWSMVTVVASGVLGRYLYVRIPKTIHGHFLTMRELDEQRQELAGRMTVGTTLTSDVLERLLPAAPPAGGRDGAIMQALRFDLGRRRARAQVRRTLGDNGVPVSMHHELVRLLEERSRLEQTVALLVPFQRLFRYWHVVHLPLALLMLLVLAIHVAVAVAFGYGWPF